MWELGNMSLGQQPCFILCVCVLFGVLLCQWWCSAPRKEKFRLRWVSPPMEVPHPQKMGFEDLESSKQNGPWLRFFYSKGERQDSKASVIWLLLSQKGLLQVQHNRFCSVLAALSLFASCLTIFALVAQSHWFPLPQGLWQRGGIKAQ